MKGMARRLPHVPGATGRNPDPNQVARIARHGSRAEDAPHGNGAPAP